MTVAQKTMMRDFNQKFFELLENYWNPINSDEYWDKLTDDAMDLICQFQTKDAVTNSLISNLVSAFLNSREDAMV
jgi:hypothetical protein